MTTGKLILKAEGGWKRTALVWLASFAVTLAILVPMAALVPLEGLTRGALLAVAAYVLMRCAYRLFVTLLPQRETERTVTWTVTEDALTLNGKTIPRGAIRNVHCWPNRDSLGFSVPGWTVNIETDGKNELLRSLTEGSPAETSAALLRKLVVALGYGRNWPES
ncbi:hypothetical protein [Dysosmobacter sp.]|uniref:hypothetical protein n=1 Tax=Dysosmobacter sp. TaxID=2591382 RepID=UPI002A862305|nr:hypothetical protein [Dysosmobacter sp.]MDY3280790.1 hypothetical protein [Dysosmobacter sp.]